MKQAAKAYKSRPKELNGSAFNTELGTSNPKEPWQRPDCPKYDTCSAPICPLDPSSLKHCIWYPGEEICTNPRFREDLWIQNQKKITKALGLRPTNDPVFGLGYYNYVMLQRRFIVRKGIRGIDPNEKEAPQVEKWLRDHPEFDEAEMKDRTKKMRENLREPSGRVL